MDEVITINLEHNGYDLEEERDDIELEPILNNFTESYLRELRYCMPARIVGVQFIEELRVDVQPLNKIRYEDNTVSELPVIYNVPMMFYGTDDSALLFSPKQGQTVLLLFSQLSLDEFKGGSTTPYESRSNRLHDINDAICLPSVSPFNRSPNRKLRHFTDHSTDDMTLVHNLGTEKENKLVLKKNGSVSIIAPKTLDIDSPNSTFSGDVNIKGNVEIDGKLDVKGIIKSDTDVFIGTLSLKKFTEAHTHAGVQTGNGNTLPPNPIA